MTVRSDLLVGPVGIAVTADLTAGPAANETWIVRTVTLVNAGGTQLSVDIGVDFTDTAHLIRRGESIPASGFKELDVWWAIDYPHVLRVIHVSGTPSLTVTMFGARLAGVAP